MQINLLTWNTLGGADYEKEIAYVKALQPDVFCLQEIERNFPGHYDGRDVDVLAKWQEAFPEFASRFAPILYRKDETEHGVIERAMGNAIFSRLPITAEATTYFVKQPDWAVSDHQNQARNLLCVRVAAGTASLLVATCHLTYEPGFTDTDLQLREAKEIVRVLSGEEHIVLAGDFNSLPGSRVVTELKRNFQEVEDQQFFTFARIHWGYNEFEVNSLQYKIDYLFHTSGVRAKKWPLPDSDASDHLPLGAVVDSSLIVGGSREPALFRRRAAAWQGFPSVNSIPVLQHHSIIV